MPIVVKCENPDCKEERKFYTDGELHLAFYIGAICSAIATSLVWWKLT